MTKAAAVDPADLFRHVSAEKAVFYRCIMDVFAAANRQYRLQLRPDEVLAAVQWPEGALRIEEVNAALTQLAEWGNLQSQPDTARVATLNDFYRARFLYRLSLGGEAVEAGLATFFQTLQHRRSLKTKARQAASRRRAGTCSTSALTSGPRRTGASSARCCSSASATSASVPMQTLASPLAEMLAAAWSISWRARWTTAVGTASASNVCRTVNGASSRDRPPAASAPWV
jgi:hypothetical protein